jgi:hypothetical protein
MRLGILISILFILMLSMPAKCQQDVMKRAYEGYQNGNLIEAKTYVDSAMTFQSLTIDPSTWYLRGFIYKDLFKDENNNGIYRKEAISAFTHLLEMENIEKYQKDAKQNIKYLSTTYYNDAVSALDRGELENAVKHYKNFSLYYPVGENATIDLLERDINFYLAIGSKHTNLNNRDTSGNDHYFEQAIAQFNKVLELDDQNLKANYNLGVLYYNKAVNVIAKLDYGDIDIFAISELEDRSIQLFEIALPYLQLAYQINPQDINTLEGLSGIYYGLRDFDKSNQYKAKVEELSK